MRFIKVVKAKLRDEGIDFKVAEHMQKTTILIAFVRAHCASQTSLVKYFGAKSKTVDSVELARTILQSQASCYRAIYLVLKE